MCRRVMPTGVSIANLSGLLPIPYLCCLMQQLISQIEEYKKGMAAAQAADAKEAEAFRIKYLGTKGVVKAIMGEMRNVAAEQRKEAGQLLNEFKQYAEARFEELKAGISGAAEQTTAIDLSLPGDPLPLGGRHRSR